MTSTRLRIPIASIVMVVLAAACSPAPRPTDTAAVADSVDPVDLDRASSQLSLDDAPAPATRVGPAEDTEGADTSTGDEAALDDETDSPLETPLDLGCSTPPTGRFRVEVLLDDADGGLRLRSGAGTTNDIVLAMPTGTEVAALGGCEVSDTGREWFELGLVTDPQTTGWAAADWLVPWQIIPCTTGTSDLAGLVDVHTTTGDFDGDGQSDILTLGNHEEGDTAVAQVEFANGGFVGGPIDIERVGEVLTTFRPIGASHDLVLARNVLQSGASTTSWSAIAVADCALQTSDAIFDGVVVESSLAGSCFEATPLGGRLWTWFQSFPTDADPDPTRTWTAWMWHNGAFAETPALDFGSRSCLHPDDVAQG